MLGYAPSVHRKAAKAARKMFSKHAALAKGAAKRGACATAIKELSHASAWHGVAVAEFLDSGPKKGAANVGPTKKVLIATRKAVSKGCTCKRRK
ncbi:MAG: hypothetical protein ACRCSL_04790 [Microbacterium sp.]